MTEGMETKKQENTTPKQISMQKNHANDIHTKLVHTVKDKVCASMNNLYYSVKGAIEVCEYCATAKSKQKLLHKVSEQHDLDQP